MLSKRCEYKSCNNISYETQELTFFAFPVKDQEKCKKWAELAGCELTNYRNKYLCEDHFDSIYISRNPRRTILLLHAVPFFYKEIEKVDVVEHEFDDDQLHRDNESTEELYDVLDEPDEKEISDDTLPTTSDPVAIYDNNDDNEMKRRYLEASAPLSNITKRKKLQNIQMDEGASIQTSEELPQQNDEDVDKEGAMDSKDMIITDFDNNPDITTFIYRDEEYIQMPKRIYLQQRIKLDTELRRYKSIVKDIKGYVVNIQLD